MNTLNGYSKSTLTDKYVLTAAGGHLAVGNAANNIPLNNNTVNTNLDADKLDGYHLTDIIPSGYITSGTAGLSNYWGKLWDYTQTNNDNSDITFYIHSAYGLERGFVHINLRRNSSTTDGTTTYTMLVNMHQIIGNIPTTDLRLYYNTSGLVQLWANCGARWGVYNCKLISCTSRTGKEGKLKGTIYATNFTAAQTLPTDSYIELSNVPAATANLATSASLIPVTLHTTDNTEYPLVWSNKNNTNSSTSNLLYKSYSDLIYNPANKRITIKGLVETPKIQNASGILTLNGQTNIYLKINNTDSSAVNLASTYFKPFGSAKNLIDLGTSDARWKGIYVNTGDFTGDVLSGTKFKASNSNGAVSVYAATNRGLYDETNSAWIVYLLKDASHVYIPKWASKGSSTLPVYFNGSGEPVVCTSYAKAIKAITRSGTTFTYTCIDGTTGTFTLQDNNSTYAVYGKTINASYKTAYRTQTGRASGYYLAAIRCDTASVDKAPLYGSGIAFGMADTHGYLYMNYSSANAYIGAGNADKLNWTATLLHSENSSVSGGGSSWGSSITVKIAGTSKTLTIPANPNTHWTTRIYAGASGTAANAAATNPYLKVTDDNTYRNLVRFVGGGATTVSSDASGNITISSTDTTYSFAAKGSATQGIYLSGTNTFATMTYSLKATVNAGTASKLAYYSGANAISAYTSTVGSSVLPIYMNAGVPTACDVPMVQYWARYIVTLGGSSSYCRYTKYGGNHNFITAITYSSGGKVNLTCSIPSGWTSYQTMIFGNGFARANSAGTAVTNASVYPSIYITSNFTGSGTVTLYTANDSTLDYGTVWLHFLCIS